MFESLTRASLPQKNHGVLRGPSSTRPALWRVEENGRHAIVKDFSANGFLFRNTVGRFLVWRESKAFRTLGSLRGIPTLYRVVDGLALVLEEIPGINLEQLEKQGNVPETFFDDLKNLVDMVHKKGLAHCDLKRAANTLLGHDGLPYLVDWGASISEREFGFSLLHLIYRRFLLDDYLAITKLKLRFVPESLTRAEIERYHRRSKSEKLVRALRDRLRELLQKLA